jgi:hypothetical protein
MPVVLAPEAWPAWLGEEPADEAQLKALLALYPSEFFPLIKGDQGTSMVPERVLSGDNRLANRGFLLGVAAGSPGARSIGYGL